MAEGNLKGVARTAVAEVHKHTGNETFKRSSNRGASTVPASGSSHQGRASFAQGFFWVITL